MIRTIFIPFIICLPIPAALAQGTPLALSTFTFPITSNGTDAKACMPAPVQGNYKLIGGGASIEGGGAGNILMSSYPDGSCWRAIAKSAGTLKVWAVAILDPTDGWEVRVFQNKVVQNSATFPAVTVSVDPGYTMTAGGARVEGGGGLTASWPTSANSWEARGEAQRATGVTSYILSVKQKAGSNPLLKAQLFRSTAKGTASAEVTDPAEPYIMTGGGGGVRSGSGMLTSSMPAGAVPQKVWTVGSNEAAGSVEAMAVGVTIGRR